MTLLSHSAAIPLPTSKSIKDMIGDLVGREVSLSPGPAVLPMLTDAYVAIYIDDATRMCALTVFDLPLAGALGGALGLLPPARVHDAVAKRSLPENAEENVAEVVNVMAALFNVPGAPHLRLQHLMRPDDSEPAQALALTGALGRRVDLVVEVTDYGSGGLSIVVAR
jgi:hypothetical protein